MSAEMPSPNPEESLASAETCSPELETYVATVSSALDTMAASADSIQQMVDFAEAEWRKQVGPGYLSKPKPYISLECAQQGAEMAMLDYLHDNIYERADDDEAMILTVNKLLGSDYASVRSLVALCADKLLLSGDIEARQPLVGRLLTDHNSYVRSETVITLVELEDVHSKRGVTFEYLKALPIKRFELSWDGRREGLSIETYSNEEIAAMKADQ